MSFKGWNYSDGNYSQEGLEVLHTPQIISRIPPAYIQQPIVSPLSIFPPQRSTQSFPEQGGIEKTLPPLPRLVWRVSATTFLFAIIAGMAIATAGILGGLLGTRSMSCPPMATNSPPTPTTPTTSTSSTTNPFATSLTVPLACPSLTSQITTYIPTNDPSSPPQTFNFTCASNCPNKDIVAIWSYSVDMCVDSCVSFTQMNATGVRCEAVTFWSELGGGSGGGVGGNCLLKTGCPVMEGVAGGIGDEEGVVSAVVVG